MEEKIAAISYTIGKRNNLFLNRNFLETDIVGYMNEAIYVTIYVVVKPELKNSSEETLDMLMNIRRN